MDVSVGCCNLFNIMFCYMFSDWFMVQCGKTNAVAIAALSSQNPGVITIANAVFVSNPPINPDVLVKAFQ